MRLIAVVVLAALVLSGCYYLGIGPDPVLEFADRDSPSGSGSVASRALTLEPDESLQALEAFYDPTTSSIGSLVGSYTPSKFRLFIHEIILYNGWRTANLDVMVSELSATDQSMHYADFVDDVVIAPPVATPRGTFPGMYFFFFSQHGMMSAGSDGPDGPADFYVPIESLIGVTIPGYGSPQVWADDESDDLGLSGAYTARRVSGDYYEFAPAFVQPYNWSSLANLPDIDGVPQTFPLIDQFIYTADGPYRAILPGIDGHPAIWDTADPDTANLPAGGSMGNTGAVFMPFEGVQIPAFARSVTFRVEWDLDGIIEVYDAGTPDDKTDDVVVFARNFWERFSLVPVYE